MCLDFMNDWRTVSPVLCCSTYNASASSPPIYFSLKKKKEGVAIHSSVNGRNYIYFWHCFPSSGFSASVQYADNIMTDSWNNQLYRACTPGRWQHVSCIRNNLLLLCFLQDWERRLPTATGNIVVHCCSISLMDMHLQRGLMMPHADCSISERTRRLACTLTTTSSAA